MVKLAPPAVPGYTCIGVVNLTVNNPRCLFSKITEREVTVYNCAASGASFTVYARWLYVLEGNV